jgi:hypothetical protein
MRAIPFDANRPVVVHAPTAQALELDNCGEVWIHQHSWVKDLLEAEALPLLRAVLLLAGLVLLRP